MCIVGSRLTSPRPSIVGRSRKRALSHSPISDFLDIQSLTRSSEGSLQFPPFNLSTHNSRSSSAASGSYGHLSAGECVRLYNTQEILSLIEGIFLILGCCFFYSFDNWQKYHDITFKSKYTSQDKFMIIMNAQWFTQSWNSLKIALIGLKKQYKDLSFKINWIVKYPLHLVFYFLCSNHNTFLFWLKV